MLQQPWTWLNRLPQELRGLWRELYGTGHEIGGCWIKFSCLSGPTSLAMFEDQKALATAGWVLGREVPRHPTTVFSALLHRAFVLYEGASLDDTAMVLLIVHLLIRALCWRTICTLQSTDEHHCQDPNNSSNKLNHGPVVEDSLLC
uniref:Uncharacterized protein n=1 Tax=Eutreptiella gymnastica TaxID=73025 RepID=A0A7S4LCQ5_9EUGL